MKKKSTTKTHRKLAVPFATVRKLALALPNVQEGSSYGTPGFKVRGKFMLRLKEDGESLAVRVSSIEERDMMLRADPRVFFITDHYQNYPAVLVRLATATVPKFRELFEEAWRSVAPPRLVAEFNKRS